MPFNGSCLGVAISVTALAIAGCASEIPVTPNDIQSDLGGATDDGQGSDGSDSVGPVTATADPGHAWIEVDGGRIVYEANGSQHYRCEIQRDRFTIDYKMSGGHTLSFSASVDGDSWGGRVFFTPDGANDVRYSAVVPRDGSLGLDGGAVSYQGIVERIEDADPSTAAYVDAHVAVNCDFGGGNPTATFGDRTIRAPFSGAESLACTVSQDERDVNVKRLGLDDKQISVEAIFDGASWLGSVFVTEGGDRYLSAIPADGAGLEIDGTSVSYQGSFIHTSKSEPNREEEVEGIVAVSCP